MLRQVLCYIIHGSWKSRIVFFKSNNFSSNSEICNQHLTNQIWLGWEVVFFLHRWWVSRWCKSDWRWKTMSLRGIGGSADVEASWLLIVSLRATPRVSFRVSHWRSLDVTTTHKAAPDWECLSTHFNVCWLHIADQPDYFGCSATRNQRMDRLCLMG